MLLLLSEWERNSNTKCPRNLPFLLICTSELTNVSHEGEKIRTTYRTELDAAIENTQEPCLEEVW